MLTLSIKHPNNQPYNWLLYERNFEFLDRLSENFRGHLFDLGCGEMPYREWLLNYADSYTGVDWGYSLHELKADIVADLNEPLPIDSEIADTIISLSVMEHLREPRVFLREAHRILKGGGAIILQVPFMWRVHEAPIDFYRYTRFGLQYLFERAGFVDVQVYAQTGFWTMWTLKFNYQTLGLIKGPRLIRKMIAVLLRVVWAVDQRAARHLDRIWKGDDETAGYFVVARKACK